MNVYYNENDARAAAWLRALISRGVIPDGEVDTRSIVDVRAADLVGFRQCHFFAGIGGWAYAARLADWPLDQALWTGSCPCQPWSGAGKGEGVTDPRHLWPAWERLIVERRPPTVVGEQVASLDGLYWLDLVFTAMEAADYAIGAIDLPAAGAGAPHGRPRLWFVADDNRSRRGELGEQLRQNGDTQSGLDAHGSRAPLFGMVHANGAGRSERARGPETAGHGGLGALEAGVTRGFWAGAEWVACRDGVARPFEPGAFPLAYGIPARVGRLRGYGNAIVPELAALVLRAAKELRPAV